MDRDAELLGEVVEGLREMRDFDTWSVRRFTRGEHVLLLELEDDTGQVSAGVVHRPKDVPVPSSSDVRHRTIEDLTDWVTRPVNSDTDRGERAVGLSVLNALSAPFIPWREGDPMALLTTEAEVVVTVGFFRPAMNKFQGAEVRVIERKSEPRDWTAPSDLEVRFYQPEQRIQALEGAEVLFLTGSSLIYGGAAEYLRLSSSVPHVILIGHTSSFLPRPLFERGVTILAGARVEDVGDVRQQVLEGGCASEMHRAGLKKVFVTPDTADESPDLEFEISRRRSGEMGENG